MESSKYVFLIRLAQELDLEDVIPSDSDPNILAEEAGKIVNFCLNKRLAPVGNGDTDADE
jgi:hypothetical protein